MKIKFKPPALECLEFSTKYVLDEKRDLDILYKCKKLEKLNISKSDRRFVKFLKTQLEEDWRKPLIKKLNALLRKYS